jgi:hypothetical protein
VTGLQLRAPANLSVVVANMNTRRRRRKKVTRSKQPPVMDCKHQSTVTFYKNMKKHSWKIKKPERKADMIYVQNGRNGIIY